MSDWRKILRHNKGGKEDGTSTAAAAGADTDRESADEKHADEEEDADEIMYTFDSTRLGSHPPLV